MHTIFKKAQTSWIWFGVAILFISMAGPSQGGGLDEGFGYDLPLSTDEIDNYEIFTSLVPLGEHSLKRLEEDGFVVMADPFSCRTRADRRLPGFASGHRPDLRDL